MLGTPDLGRQMGAEIEAPVTYAVVRSMTVVAAEASEMAESGLLSTTHKKAIEVVSRRVVEDLTPGRIVGVFSVRAGDTVVARLRLEPSILEAYLKTLDLVAAQTPRPYVRTSCQRLCTHLVAHADLDSLGIRPGEYGTVDLEGGEHAG